MDDFTVSNAVVCDDVRKEMSGKDILIGVYASSMNISSLPAQLNLCFWMEIVPKKSGNLSMEFKLETPGKHPPTQLRIDATIGDVESSFGIFTPQITVIVTEDGEFKLFARPLGQEKWRIVKRVKVTYKAVSFNAPPF